MLRCSCSACHPPVNSWPPTAACRPADFSAYRLLRHWLPGKPPDEAAAAAAGSGGSGGQPPPSGLLAALADAGSAIVCGGLAGMVMWAVRHLSWCRGCWLSWPGVGVLPAGSAGRQQQRCCQARPSMPLPRRRSPASSYPCLQCWPCCRWTPPTRCLCCLPPFALPAAAAAAAASPQAVLPLDTAKTRIQTAHPGSYYDVGVLRQLRMMHREGSY